MDWQTSLRPKVYFPNKAPSQKRRLSNCWQDTLNWFLKLMTSSQCKVCGPSASPQVERQALKPVFIVANPLYHIATWRTAAPKRSLHCQTNLEARKARQSLIRAMDIKSSVLSTYYTPSVQKLFKANKCDTISYLFHEKQVTTDYPIGWERSIKCISDFNVSLQTVDVALVRTGRNILTVQGCPHYDGCQPCSSQR